MKRLSEIVTYFFAFSLAFIFWADPTNDKGKQICAVKYSIRASPTKNIRRPVPDSPTNPFAILEPDYQEIGEFYVVEERRATDF